MLSCIDTLGERKGARYKGSRVGEDALVGEIACVSPVVYPRVTPLSRAPRQNTGYLSAVSLKAYIRI